MKTHTQWSSKLGFILATAGAAIGLGNLWKFPYLMGRNGGFWFLIAYIFFAIVLGLPVMVAEMSLGRKTRRDPVRAYAEIHPRARIVGVFGVLAAFLILSYYSVIGGWVLKYFFSYLTRFAPPESFDAFISAPFEPVVWHLLFMAMTAFVCLHGVSGIERAGKLMMPALFVLLLVVIGRSVTLPGAGGGFAFMFLPSASAFTLGSVNAALGQVFYSLSLCMGITITYGSYLSRKEDIPRACATVAGLDTLMALLAGIAIFPAVFAFGLEPAQGPSLLFGTLPEVFGSFAGGTVFALLFFLLVFFAALTSAIALLEVVLSYAMERFHMKRKRAVLVLSALVFALGIPSALSFGTLGDVRILGYSVFDFVCMVTDNLLLPVGGVLMCWYLGWRWKPELLVEEIEREGVRFGLARAWRVCIRFITPILVLIVTLSGFVSIYRTITG